MADYSKEEIFDLIVKNSQEYEEYKKDHVTQLTDQDVLDSVAENNKENGTGNGPGGCDPGSFSSSQCSADKSRWRSVGLVRCGYAVF